MMPSIYYMSNRRTEDIAHLQLTRQRAQQAEGEHGGGSKMINYHRLMGISNPDHPGNNVIEY